MAFSTRIYNLTPLFLLLNSKKKNFLPSIFFSTRLKYNPINNDVNKEKNFFLQSIECKKILLYLCNHSAHMCKFNFYKTKKLKTKFRKRKNIFFNIAYSSNVSNRRAFFFNLPNLITFFKINSTQLYLNYDFYTNILKFRERKNKIEFIFFNMHFFLSYINNLKFTKNNYIYILNLLFPSNPLSEHIKRALFYYLLRLNEEIKI